MINNKSNKELEKYINKWLERVEISCKRSTYTQYLYIVNKRIRPVFNNIKIKDITDNIINKYTWSLINEGLDNKTIRDILLILKNILKEGNKNITINLPKPKKKKIIIISKKDQELIENNILNDINEYNIGIYLCLYTGLRIGEICALKWENIDLDKMVINIEKNLIRVKNRIQDSNIKTKVILDEPKSLSSIRTIPIPKLLIPILHNLQKEENIFFLTGSIKYIEPRSYRNYYNKFLNKINIETKYNFHALRHTFATRCIEIGCDPKTLSEILGHSNVKITLDRYVHPNFENKVKLIDCLCSLP